MDKNSLNRAAVFIDNSNIFHSLHNLRKIDSKWICLYDPLVLSKKLAGNRKIVYVGFYCAPPPSYLSFGDSDEKYRYSMGMQYYSSVEKIEGVEVKYATVNGVRGALQEKNLDTQLATDVVLMGAQNKFDIAILVSNDGDYVSAVKSAKALGKKVELGYFKNEASMALRKESDLSRRLRQSYFVKVNESEKNQTLFPERG